MFEKPDRNDIDWDDFKTLLIYLGVSIRQQGGSAHGIKLNGDYAVFHKPHPGHTLYQADLKRIRRFFTNAAIKKVEK
ncbi:MAG TPA: hexulose-6-phosphate synthase [Anaerolineaceae bacterium]|nr:hexulose-6-phosphate synthase [Anaerolineaceae bacterium]